MTLAILPLLQPLNNTEIQAKSSSNSNNTEENSFPNTFDTAFKENKVMSTSDDGKNRNKMLKSQKLNSKLEKNIPAQKFLKEIGIEESDIQNIFRAAGLNPNMTLIEFLKSFNFQITDLDDFMEMTLQNFLSQLGMGKEKIDKIVQPLIGKTESSNETAINGESKSIISVKDLLQKIGIMSEKDTAVKGENLSADNFLQKLGLNKNESRNLMKELGISQQMNDKATDNAQRIKTPELLEKIGLNSDEISKIIEKSLENSDHKNTLKNLLLNKDLNGLKKFALLEKSNVSLSEKANFQGLVQTGGKKTVSEAFSGKIQSEMILSSNAIKNNLPVSPQTSTSGNGANMNNGAMGLAAQLIENSNEIQTTNLRLNEHAPKSFFERTVIDQIVSKVNFKMTGGQEEMRIHLEPPSLGSLHMKVSVDGKVVSATIIVDNSFTKDIIQSNIHQLKDSMAEQGLKLDSLSVLVGGEGSRDMNMDDFRSLLTEEKIDQLIEHEDENPGNLMEQNSGNLHLSRGLSAQSGVDLFI